MILAVCESRVSQNVGQPRIAGEADALELLPGKIASRENNIDGARSKGLREPVVYVQ